ncbi:MAG: N-acetylmuramoyl-L-alanine amidase, partial [Proteobacteria bacterium]|nr:N-acetylmuramoyl-L-alanine amidase [Pseudomonadota bacterium]
MSYRVRVLRGLAIISAMLSISSGALAQDDQSGLWPMQDMLGSESPEAVQSAMEHGLAVRQARNHVSPRALKKGALSGKRISLSAGHGIELSNGAWNWQRGITQNLREDKHTYEWVSDYVRPMLERAGAETLMMRAYSYTETTTIIKYGGSGYTETGTWTKSSSGDYKYADGNSTESATATWSFTVPEDGYYPVYVRYFTSDNRIPDAQYTIVHARGESVVLQNQSMKYVNSGSESMNQNTAKSSANVWRYLGLFPFKASEKGAVRLSNVTSTSGKVVIADSVQIGDGPGVIKENGKVSGQNKWQECALEWMKYMGLPEWVTKAGDVSGRSMYSLYEGVDAQLSLHTNAFKGESRGTQTYVWYPLNSSGNLQWVREDSWQSGHKDNQLPPGTYNYAKHIHQRFLDYMKTYISSSWTGSQYLHGAGFGELRPTRNAWYNNKNNAPLIIPALLIETAFHDNSADARQIREANFRYLGARGIVAGMIQHFKGDDNAMIPPMPPNKLTVTAEGDHLNLSWAPVADKVLSNSVPTKYNIYTSDDGLLFDVDPLLVVDGTTATLPISPGQTIYVRITAVNDAGESLDSLVGAGRLPKQNKKKILYIDGVDREVKTVYDPNNVRSYARIFAPAILFNDAGYGIDTVDDDAAVELLKTHKYDAVVWVVGQTSISHDVLPSEQRTLVEQLRASKTPLLMTGAEIGYAMADSGYNSNASWLSNNFDAVYADDQAYSSVNATQKVSATGLMSGEVVYSGCITDGGSASKRTVDAYCVIYPDVFKTANGGTAILNYIGGDVSASTGAAVLSADGKAILTGFPLETVVDPKQRLCLISNLLAKMLGTKNNDACTADTWVPDAEICGNHIDDDGNGKADCDDPACANDASCKSAPAQEICGNHIDDDGNGKADCDDPACANDASCKSAPAQEICGNHIDDD